MNTITSKLSYNANPVRTTSFKNHPDFTKLKRRGYDITASSWFRRGQFYGSPSDDYVDVINCLIQFLKDKKDKIAMLVAGIGESQEPLSLLAVIKHILAERDLKNNVDLHIIDLQSKPDDKTLFCQSFFSSPFKPCYVSESFTKDDGLKYGFRAWMHYRVKNELFKFLNATYKNPEKSLWETRLQDAVKNYPNNNFDIISINNTIGYISENNEIVETMKNIIRIQKKDGIFITDPHSDFNKLIANDTEELYKGIFKKKG